MLHMYWGRLIRTPSLYIKGSASWQEVEIYSVSGSDIDRLLLHRIRHTDSRAPHPF